mgnify:CR=1 FL=1
MGDYARGRLDLDDDDRLPWLEPAIDEEEERISPLRMLGLILLGLQRGGQQRKRGENGINQGLHKIPDGSISR